jgi:hypothetical protein
VNKVYVHASGPTSKLWAAGLSGLYGYQTRAVLAEITVTGMPPLSKVSAKERLLTGSARRRRVGQLEVRRARLILV